MRGKGWEKEKLEKKRENKSYRDRKRGRSGRALSPPLSYPQMNLSCCLIMFLSFPPTGSQANFLHSASNSWLAHMLADQLQCAARQQEVSLVMQEAAAVLSRIHTPLCTLACVLFVYMHTNIHACAWPALCGISKCYNMWACNNMSGQDSELSETFETMVTTHLISTLAKT